MRRVSSVLQLLTMTYSQFSCVWRRTLSTHSARYGSPLYTGVTTVTRGREPFIGQLSRGGSRLEFPDLVRQHSLEVPPLEPLRDRFAPCGGKGRAATFIRQQVEAGRRHCLCR